MKKRALIAIALLTLVFGSVTVQAAPKTMPDGGTFDAEFYAATYPDVQAAFGTDENLLYRHYLEYGKAEGRLPYAAGNEAAAAPASTPQTPLTVDEARAAAEAYRQQILLLFSAGTKATPAQRAQLDAQAGACAAQIAEISRQFETQKHGTVYWEPTLVNPSIKPIIPIDLGSTGGPVIVAALASKGYGTYSMLLVTPTPPAEGRLIHVIAYDIFGRKMEDYMTLQRSDGHMFVYDFYLGAGVPVVFSVFGT